MTYYKFDYNMYLDLMKNLVTGKITPHEFEQSYMKQWETDRDKQNASITSEMESKTHNIRLLRERNIITIEQYENKWCEIREISEKDSLLHNIIDRGYTTCDVYWDDATEEDVANGQLDDKGLIKEISELYVELQKLLE
ncbi:MAG: colicin immunity domain-containing protein [Planctomycetaceae bacterium]|jgi:hypothetical protein|nr:colicin immunity domain-containing protein [Planctomycetaceae bacterium]